MASRGWLIDNDVPRGVTRLLRQHGEKAVEVRDVLGPSAPDNAIAAYARSQGLWIVTKDVEFARRCRVNGHATFWLRTRQIEDAARLSERMVEVKIAVSKGPTHLVLNRDGSLEVDP